MNFLAMFEFTEDDLKSNQRGFFSASQKETIKNYADGMRKSQQGVLKVVVFFLFLGLCMILGMFLLSESYRALLFSDPTMANRLLNSELEKVEGVARLDEEHSSKIGSTYYVIINKIKFAFPEDISGTFREGKSYRIFYCETSMLKYMLSFEKIET